MFARMVVINMVWTSPMLKPNYFYSQVQIHSFPFY
ncbi:MAG: hypothetical protein ACJATO_002517, partial [Arenicella sp.]